MQNVANVSFIFETSPNLKRKRWETWRIISTPSEKRGNTPLVPPPNYVHVCKYPGLNKQVP